MPCLFGIIYFTGGEYLGETGMSIVKNKRGFTLLEMIVAVIIVVVLVSVAVSYYEQAMEEVRRADVLSLMGSTISAQDRYRLQKHHYTKLWHNLDTTPLPLRRPQENNSYANGLSNTIFYTRGKKNNNEPNQGFQVYFEQIGDKWFMTADRIGSDKYSYTLVRPFDSLQVFCVPTGGYEKNIAACLNVMGEDDPDALPPDPRIAAQQTVNEGN